MSTLDVIGRGAVVGILSAADEVLATKQLAERQTQALNAIRRLHQPDSRCSRCAGRQPCWPGPCSPTSVCRTCGPMQSYPCSTIRAIDEAGA